MSFQPQYAYSTSVDLGHFSRFVVNFNEAPETWKFKNIKQHVMDELEVPPAGHPPQDTSTQRKALADGFQEIITAKAMRLLWKTPIASLSRKLFKSLLNGWCRRLLSLGRWSIPIKLHRDGYDPLILLKGRQMYFLSGSVRKRTGKTIFRNRYLRSGTISHQQPAE